MFVRDAWVDQHRQKKCDSSTALSGSPIALLIRPWTYKRGPIRLHAHLVFVEESLTGTGPLKIVNSFVCSVIIVENIETQELPTSAS